MRVLFVFLQKKLQKFTHLLLYKYFIFSTSFFTTKITPFHLTQALQVLSTSSLYSLYKLYKFYKPSLHALQALKPQVLKLYKLSI